MCFRDMCQVSTVHHRLYISCIIYGQRKLWFLVLYMQRRTGTEKLPWTLNDNPLAVYQQCVLWASVFLLILNVAKV